MQESGGGLYKLIQVFVRHCFYSSASAHKNRPAGFSHEKCFENLLDTLDSNTELTLLLDTHFAKDEKHFVQKENRFPIVEIDAGEEGKSFLALLDYVLEQKYSDDTILYFLEDDYLHKEGWPLILQEGIELADYVTLFDHRDKYDQTIYPKLTSKIFHSESCHWRTTPSTTNTYAMKMGTLKKDLAIHRKYSTGVKISRDHKKFLKLGRRGKPLISSIPGYSTHCEPDFSSPTTDWASLFFTETVK